MDYERREMKNIWREWQGFIVTSFITILLFAITIYLKSLVPNTYLGVITNVSVVSEGYSSFMGKTQSTIYIVTIDHEKDIVIDTTQVFGGKWFCSTEYPLSAGYELWDNGTCYKIDAVD